MTVCRVTESFNVEPIGTNYFNQFGKHEVGVLDSRQAGDRKYHQLCLRYTSSEAVQVVTVTNMLCSCLAYMTVLTPTSSTVLMLCRVEDAATYAQCIMRLTDRPLALHQRLVVVHITGGAGMEIAETTLTDFFPLRCMLSCDFWDQSSLQSVNERIKSIRLTRGTEVSLVHVARRGCQVGLVSCWVRPWPDLTLHNIKGCVRNLS
jgi:hypothetical protein